ncbi:MAG: carboxylesterase/lipase family protein [Spongiibacteraceae bacterium]|nr:carboxylesterase/lipase family protein [Spongiibacteraceae bacterium]
MAGLLASYSLLPLLVRAQSSDTSLLHTAQGSWRGLNHHGTSVFKGIAYGENTRSRRFQSPLPIKPWQGVRDALEYGDASPQSRARETYSENCLFLNVWTPKLRDGGKRPILVYLHGGEFSHGSGSDALYDGTRLCERGDVTVITLNHRLSAFGHLYLKDFSSELFKTSGNVALLDIVLALKWVQNNAAQIGGDANNVTLFGQSGGGAKIVTLMAMPVARGLFHKAFTMSGQQITAAGPRAASTRATHFLQALKINPNKPSDLQKLMDLATDKVVEAISTPDHSLPGRSIYFGPVLDNHVLKQHPFYPNAPALSADIPMIIGNTRGETRAFHGNDPGIHSLNWEQLAQRLGPALYVDIDTQHVIDQYRRLYPQYSASDIFFAATTAGRSWRGAIIEAEQRAHQGSPAFVYQLDWGSPLEGGKWGAFHSIDIALVFDNTAQTNARTGNGPQAQQVAAAMSESLIAFARTGKPKHAGIPDWKPYTLEKRETLVFNTESHLRDDPRGAERKLFAHVPFIQRGTF